MNLRYRFLGILDFEKSNIFQEKSRIYFVNLQTKFSERCRWLDNYSEVPRRCRISWSLTYATRIFTNISTKWSKNRISISLFSRKNRTKKKTHHQFRDISGLVSRNKNAPIVFLNSLCFLSFALLRSRFAALFSDFSFLGEPTGKNNIILNLFYLWD